MNEPFELTWRFLTWFLIWRLRYGYYSNDVVSTETLNLTVLNVAIFSKICQIIKFIILQVMVGQMRGGIV